MKLYFGNTVTIITTIMILVLLGFIVESIVYRNKNLGYVRDTVFFDIVIKIVIYPVTW